MTPPITTNPRSAYGTLGLTGTIYYEGAFGGLDSYPDHGTAPEGEMPLIETQHEPGTAPVTIVQEITPDASEVFLHEQVHGVPWDGYDLGEWVNPSNPGIPNLGPPNEQDFQSGHTSAIVHNQSLEQGAMLDPAILVTRYPKSENVNPFYATGSWRRNGTFIPAIGDLPFGQLTQGSRQMQAMGRRRVSVVHGRVADVPVAVPFSSNRIPVGGNAGPMNILPLGTEGIYDIPGVS